MQNDVYLSAVLSKEGIDYLMEKVIIVKILLYQIHFYMGSLFFFFFSAISRWMFLGFWLSVESASYTEQIPMVYTCTKNSDFITMLIDIVDSFL